MSEEEREAVVTLVAMDPGFGNVVPGAGGIRKFRVRKPGTGKSDGYRVISFFGSQSVPVFLLTVFGKGEKANLSRAECNALARLVKRLGETYGT